MYVGMYVKEIKKIGKTTCVSFIISFDWNYINENRTDANATMKIDAIIEFKNRYSPVVLVF